MTIGISLYDTTKIIAEAWERDNVTCVNLVFENGEGELRLNCFTESLAIAQAYADAINGAREALENQKIEDSKVAAFADLDVS